MPRAGIFMESRPNEWHVRVPSIWPWSEYKSIESSCSCGWKSLQLKKREKQTESDQKEVVSGSMSKTLERRKIRKSVNIYKKEKSFQELTHTFAEEGSKEEGFVMYVYYIMKNN